MAPSHGMVFAQTEPVGGWTAAGEVVLKHAEAQPTIFFPLLSLLGVFALIAGFAYVYVRFYLPTYREQKGLDREHLAGLVAQRGREAQEEVAAARELAKAQQAAIVEKIGNEVSRHTGELVKLVDRSDRHGELLSRVAAKIGVGLVLALLLGVAAGKAYSFYATAAPSCRCDPPYPSRMRCTCSGCQEVKTTTTTSVASKPHSALDLDMYANIASFNCASASSACN